MDGEDKMDENKGNSPPDAHVPNRSGETGTDDPAPELIEEEDAERADTGDVSDESSSSEDSFDIRDYEDCIKSVRGSEENSSEAYDPQSVVQPEERPEEKPEDERTDGSEQGPSGSKGSTLRLFMGNSWIRVVLEEDVLSPPNGLFYNCGAPTQQRAQDTSCNQFGNFQEGDERMPERIMSVDELFDMVEDENSQMESVEDSPALVPERTVDVPSYEDRRHALVPDEQQAPESVMEAYNPEEWEPFYGESLPMEHTKPLEEREGGQTTNSSTPDDPLQPSTSAAARTENLPTREERMREHIRKMKKKRWEE